MIPVKYTVENLEKSSYIITLYYSDGSYKGFNGYSVAIDNIMLSEEDFINKYGLMIDLKSYKDLYEWALKYKEIGESRK